jgi:hypothetical protein
MICESSNPTAIITDMLAEVGWVRDGSRLVPAHDASGTKHNRCAVFDGLIYGVPRTAFVCIDTHLVMLTGCQTDLELKTFLEHVKRGEPVPKKSKSRGLFDE